MSIWEFIYIHAAPIGGLIVVLVTILEFVFYKKTQKRWKRGLILVQSTIVSVAFFVLIYFTWTPKNAWENWRDDVLHDFNPKCHININSTHKNSHISSDFFCLANAIKTNPIPNRNFRKGITNDAASRDYSDSLMRTINSRNAMEFLMTDTGVSEVLTKTYGIYPNLFLGTGLTKPNDEVSGRQNGVREYLVTNFCADETVCNTKLYPKHNNIWTWRFSNKDAAKLKLLEEDVSKIIFEMESFRVEPNFEPYRNQISAYLKKGQTKTQAILVRFASFNPEFYQGTVGRPNRKLTFFSDLREVHDYPLREASQLSGIPPSETNVENDYFIWLVILDPAKLDYKPASWDEVLEDIIDSAVE